MITTHTQLLNYLIEKHSLKSYLEIGVRTVEQNFNKIKCGFKTGVDPCLKTDKTLYGGTSDQFFSFSETKYDLIFIDGLHHADQVRKDFENSLRCLNDNGFIVIHDVLPEEEITTCVPRGEQKIWHGDVYKWAMNISSYPGIGFQTLNIDCGCLVVWWDKNSENAAFKIEIPEQWNYFQEYKKLLLNIVDKPTF